MALTILEPELDGYSAALKAILRDVGSLTRGLDSKQIDWSPSPDVWSVAMCLRHLLSTTNAYLPMIDSAIEIGRQRDLIGKGPFRHGWFFDRFIRSLEPPADRRLWAPSIFSPDLVDAQDVGEKFDDSQEELITRVQAVGGLDLARIKVSFPALQFVRMSLGQAFAVLAAHQRRHLWQAHEIRRHREFPRVVTN